MKEFIDKTSENSGTPINRANLMAIQGFIGRTFYKDKDGSIVEVNSEGETLRTIKNENGSYTQIFVGERIITRTITFNEDGTITEVIS